MGRSYRIVSRATYLVSYLTSAPCNTHHLMIYRLSNYTRSWESQYQSPKHQNKLQKKKRKQRVMLQRKLYSGLQQRLPLLLRLTLLVEQNSYQLQQEARRLKKRRARWMNPLKMLIPLLMLQILVERLLVSASCVLCRKMKHKTIQLV